MKTLNKQRLDVAVYEMGFAKSREHAKAIIMAGEIYVNNQKAVKAGEAVLQTDKIEFRGKKMPYVSRGGYKLEKAVKSFPIALDNKICMDIGASTGGFTDCMLQNGALKVYSIDVGYGQLDWKLRMDTRVVNLERTNFRYLTKEKIPDKIDFASIDVSFISLTKIIPVLHGFMNNNAYCTALIKPQFEAGRDKVGKKGVVRDISVHSEVVNHIVDFACHNGFSVLGLTYSPIKGPEGNIEYLIFIKKSDSPVISDAVNVEKVIKESHKELQ